MIESATDLEEQTNLGLTERQLSRVEDMAVLMLRGTSSSGHMDYVLLPSREEPELAICQVKRLAPAMRFACVGEALRSRGELKATIEAQAAYILQTIWRRRRAVKVPVPSSIRKQ